MNNLKTIIAILPLVMFWIAAAIVWTSWDDLVSGRMSPWFIVIMAFVNTGAVAYIVYLCKTHL
jgi:hypothetical protein